MAWQPLKFVVTGVAPIIMHNGDLADPRNIYAKQMKERTGKRQKTDADLLDIEKIEFLGGLYTNDKGNIILPARLIEATLVKAATKSREKNLAKSGLFCTQDALLNFRGPQTPAKLWEDEQFHWREMVVVSRARISRMRPIFHDWSAEFVVQYEDTVINATRVRAWVEVAGKFIGFGERRPKFGRFEVE